jgi:hypothetical protein
MRVGADHAPRGSVSGRVTATKSLSASSRSRPSSPKSSSTPGGASAGRRLRASTRIPSAVARRESSRPIPPKPSTRGWRRPISRTGVSDRLERLLSHRARAAPARPGPDRGRSGGSSPAASPPWARRGRRRSWSTRSPTGIIPGCSEPPTPAAPECTQRSRVAIPVRGIEERGWEAVPHVDLGGPRSPPEPPASRLAAVPAPIGRALDLHHLPARRTARRGSPPRPLRDVPDGARLAQVQDQASRPASEIPGSSAAPRPAPPAGAAPRRACVRGRRCRRRPRSDPHPSPPTPSPPAARRRGRRPPPARAAPGRGEGDQVALRRLRRISTLPAGPAASGRRPPGGAPDQRPRTPARPPPSRSRPPPRWWPPW